MARLDETFAWFSRRITHDSEEYEERKRDWYIWYTFRLDWSTREYYNEVVLRQTEHVDYGIVM